MIESQDRSLWFGASDCRYIMSDNCDTKTWKNWWAIKLGLAQNDFTGNIYTSAGNRYEHPISEALNVTELDGTLYVPKYRLRVNYDGWKDGLICEIKTFRCDKEFPYEESPKNNYWRQCQVEMYCYMNCVQNTTLPPYLPPIATDRKGKPYMLIVGYSLNPEEYYSDAEPIVDINKLDVRQVFYDRKWIKSCYLPKLKKLARQLKKGIGDE